MLGGLLYSFTGFMILGGGWYVFSYQAVLIALLLYSFEKLFKQDIWILMPLPIALIGISQPFNLYVCGFFLFGYATIRYLGERQWKLKDFSLLLAKIGGTFMLGVAISSVFLFSNTLQVLQSPRAGSEASYFHILSSRAIFRLEDPLQYISVVSRFFSNDLLGTGSDFRGWDNYLESPMLYCGLVSLLLAPQVFSFMDKRRKRLFLILVGLIVIPSVFPYFRYLFWLFTGDYFRTFSFFITLVILFFSMQSLSYIDRLSRINLKVLLLSLIVALAVLYLPFDGKNEIIDHDLRLIVSVFLVLYTVLIVVMGSRKFKVAAQLGLLLVVCVELAYFSNITVSKRSVVTSDELHRRIGYNDYTNDAVAYLNSIDKSFFRVNKDYFSSLAAHESLDDASIQGYKGTPSYNQWNQPYYIQFLQEVGVIPLGDEHSTRWSLGLLNRPLLQTWASVKYALTKSHDSALVALGYEFLKKFEDIRVYRNRYFLPLGFTYESYILNSDFSRLTQVQKNIVLLKAFVLDDSGRARYNGFRRLNVSDISSTYTFKEYGTDVNALRHDTLTVTVHEQNIIRGTINLQSKKLLFLSIPYDRGWSIEVDRRESSPELVNIGFIGLSLEAGEHTIEMKYFPPLVKAGSVVSVAGILLLIVLFIVTSKRKIRESPKAAKTPPETFQNEVRKR